MKFKAIIIFFVVFLGGGILFTFGISYFLSHVIGIDRSSINSMTDNLPDEFKSIKWIIGGVGIITVLGTILPVLLPVALMVFIFSKYIKSKWNSLDKNADSQNVFSGNNIQDILNNLKNKNQNTTAIVNGNTSEIVNAIQKALQNAQNTTFQNTGTLQVSGAGIFLGITLPFNMQQTNNNILQTQAPADIMLRIQASGILLNELKTTGGIPAEAKVLSQEILFENVMQDINAIELKYQMEINGIGTIDNSEVILTPKISMYKSTPGSIIHVLYNAQNPKRMAISGTDKPETTINLN